MKNLTSASSITFFGTIAIAALVACPAFAQSAPKNDPNDTAIFSDQDSPAASLNDNQPNLQDQDQSGADMDQDQDQDLGVSPNKGNAFNDQDRDQEGAIGNDQAKGQYYNERPRDNAGSDMDQDKDSSAGDSDSL